MLIFFVPVVVFVPLTEGVVTVVDEALPAAGEGVAFAVFVAEAGFCVVPAAAAAAAATPAPPFPAKACVTGFLSPADPTFAATVTPGTFAAPTPVPIFALATATPLEAVAGVEGPIARASADAASALAFSLICFCLSSSFARIGTRSSGMGLFSYICKPEHGKGKGRIRK